MIDNIGGARPAGPADLHAIADTLASAFADYPWTRWTVAADDHPRRLRALQLYFTEKVGLPYGRVWTAGDNAAAAVWTTPGIDVPPEVFTGPELAALYGDRAPYAIEAEEFLAPYRPSRPAWFLATIGVRRDMQGRGLGQAVLAPGLAEADRTGHDAYLETADERNVRFYERFGFETTADVHLPGGGPRTWCMIRRPNTAAPR
ncbi:GNAT family N-acetyltransferase [Actinomadura livida]|uniref:GNAT family N-acetyltransferase n=1 Tax=Actinomadura livida TaxID=79909 RepID=A0A7W7ID72_9ACTN|nr:MULTISPECIES: GNAT family N-acetyltransferase [Actinomadura]MBB4774941.1 GNAT superfamily N-acetyltransferase [Actinomadura catellatispora]GGU04981.1 N-acetyltransferase [Actinomadura livida]